MFRRGNIKEKARVLSFHEPTDPSLHHRAMSLGELCNKWAVDMYAGIGYFVFSYAELGMRVLCWELNPWSVEGLRRGALANGWSSPGT
ncbi:S-adenosyl-L-methionine-dependent methyltransferase [Apiospora arundinis]